MMLRRVMLEHQLELCFHIQGWRLTMLFTVHYGLDWRSMGAHYCLLSRLEVYPANN